MKQYAKRCMAWFLSIAMAVTVIPASTVQAAGETIGTTQTIECGKFVLAGAPSEITGTNGKKATMIAVTTGDRNAQGSAKGAAMIAGETGGGGSGLGGNRAAAMGFQLPGKKTTDDQGGIDPELISHAEVTIVVNSAHNNLGAGNTKAAIFQVASEKYDSLANAADVTATNFPAKDDDYTKDKTVFSGGLGGNDGWITTATKDQKLSFDVTDWIKESINAGDQYAVYRLQTANGGWYVYMQDAGENAPKLSITTLSEEDVFKQVKADIKVPSEARSNFTLPTQGVLGTSIAWASSDNTVIKVEDGRAVVTRPADADKDVTLTATLSRKEKTDTATYTVKVAKKVFGEPWATFDFNSDAQDGKFISNGVEAVISGTGTGAELTERDTDNGKALHLDGTAKWLSLQKEGGESLLTGLEELTISFDAKPDRTGTNWGFYAAPNANAQAGGKEQYIGALIKEGKTTIERYKGGRETGASAETGAEWSHVDVVFTEDATTIYVDGVRAGRVGSSYKLTDILGNNSIFQLGKANWGGGEYYQGWIDNFTLYDHALTPVELCSAEEIERMVNADKEALTIETEEVKADFDLPAQGENGSVISWTVEQNDVLKIEGNKAVVTRPSNADQTVALTAKISLGQKQETKVFQVKVIKALSSQENIQAALAEIKIPNQNDVRDNLTLPTEAQAPGETQKVTVTWESKNKSVISDSKNDKKEAGMVTRPAQDTEVELVATGHIGEETATRTITVKVKAKKEMEKTTSYLFAHFTGTEGRATDEQIYFATSEDGSQWVDMTTNGNPALDSSNIEGGDGGVRDPFLLRSHNGDKFWLIATDLSINKRGGWGSAQATSKGSTKLVIWESTDLVNWDEPRLVDVASKIPGAGCAWAPEAYYDIETGNYVVYWATASDQSNEVGDRMNMYYCTTRDFHTFTDPVLWIDRDHSIIDTTMIYNDKDKTYYRASGDGQITIEKSKSIYEGWEIIGTLNSIFGLGDNGKYSGGKLEGPEFFEYCEDDWLKDENGNPVRTWGLMCDQYSEGKGYLPFRTTNLADMTSASWSPATDVNFGSLKKRHGTILPVTDAEYKAVMKKFGYSTGDEPIEEKVLADFNFDKETSFDGGTKGFSSENAKAVGTYTLKDSYSTEAGKALYLDGSNTNFLTVTDKDGKSLLSGARELTISYEFKPDNTGTNWVMYAAPDAAKPTNNSERYLGILVKNGSTTLERYNNSGKRPTNPSVQTGSSWSRVDIVITENATTMYLNGQKITSVDSTYKLPNILGASSILQIGKANWGGGEYCKGLLDNFRIENKALSEAQVKALAADFVGQLPVEVTSATVGTAPDRETALEYRGTDDHTAITSLFDSSKKEIQPYVRKGTDLTKIPVTFGLNGAVDSIKADGKTVENGSQFDLSKDTSVTFTRGSKTATWTIKKPIISNNPVLPGQYADPDIDYFDGKFWIYPTTDGYPSWSGTVFHAFSSPDMVNWKDEGIIMELANDNPGKNEQGVQIAKSPWAVKGSAWAPTIEKKNGKYYFYYCGKESSGASSVGVAVADNPAGPYTDKGTALVTKAMTDKAGVGVGQAIDPSIFTDDNGTSYILLGNGSAVIAQLNDDMMSIKDGTLKRINGLTDFRESVVVTKANGKYHWTWSCDDANSSNYHVNYGVSDTLVGADGSANVTLKKKNLLVKDESKNILGSAHQSVVHVKDADGKDRYFMAYHRFYTPLNIFTSGDGLGKHRETCIDEITFDANGEMVIKPTLEGVSAVAVKKPVAVASITLNKESLTLGVGDSETLTATVLPEGADNKNVKWSSSDESVAEVEDGRIIAKKAGTAKITVTSVENAAIKKECTVTVEAATEGVKVTDLTLSPTEKTLTVGDSFELSCIVVPSNAYNRKVNWKSSDESIAEVSDGKVTAKKAGTVTITVTSAENASIKKECVVTVQEKVQVVEPSITGGENGKYEVTIPEITPGTPVNIQLPSTLADSIKDSQETEVSVNIKLPENLADDKVQAITIPKEVLSAAKEAGKDLTVVVTGSTSYQWTFSAKDLADTEISDLNLALEVDSEKDAELKNLLGKDETGMVLSFAQQGDIPGAKVTIDVAKMGWKAGETVTLSYYNPETKKLETAGTYKVDKDGKIAIAPDKGGKYVLWQKTGSEPEPVIPVKNITLNKTKLTLNVKKTYQLKATVTPKDATNQKVTWNSENKSVATVSANGLVKANKAGTAKITAKAGGKSITCTVTVKVPVSKVTLNKTKLTMGVKETFTLKATVKPKNATSKKVSWKTKNKKIVTVKNGKLTAKKKGNTTITATVDGKKVTCKVTVKPAPTKKTKVTLNKKKVSLKVKKTFQIKPKVSSKFGSATFKYTIDKKGKKIVKVDKNGKVTAKKKGKATITVKTYNGKAKATLKVTVKK